MSGKIAIQKSYNKYFHQFYILVGNTRILYEQLLKEIEQDLSLTPLSYNMIPTFPLPHCLKYAVYDSVFTITAAFFEFDFRNHQSTNKIRKKKSDDMCFLEFIITLNPSENDRVQKFLEDNNKYLSFIRNIRNKSSSHFTTLGKQMGLGLEYFYVLLGFIYDELIRIADEYNLDKSEYFQETKVTYTDFIGIYKRIKNSIKK